MSLARRLKQLFKAQLDSRGYEIYKRPYLPKGADVYQSLRAHWPDWQPQVVFDVGANVGQTVARLRPLFPTAEIYAFEPVPQSLAELRRHTAHDSRVHAQALALADAPGEAWIHVHASSDQSSLNPALAGATAADRRPVQLETAARFCAQHGIARIDLLKIDVEGFEMSVLRGALPLFAAGAVDFIVAEAGLSPGSPRFTPLSEMIALLQPHGFHLVGIYEQYGWRYCQTAEFGNVAFAHERHLTPGGNA